jgi:hypothetical protein
VFLPRQFTNDANVEVHQVLTGPEIQAQLAAVGRAADAFVAGVGTGGTVMGVGEFLRRYGPVRVHPLEPTNSPTLRTGRKVGHHRIQGISDEFVAAIVRLDALDPVVDVWDGDAILMAQALGARLGLGVGISSGANGLRGASRARRGASSRPGGPEPVRRRPRVRGPAAGRCDSSRVHVDSDLPDRHRDDRHRLRTVPLGSNGGQGRSGSRATCRLPGLRRVLTTRTSCGEPA